jgi:hypothetical protein
MQAIYVVPTETTIRSKSERYVHPETGEVFGQGDYENPAKLEQIGAVFLRDENPPSGYKADGWEIVDDPENEGWKLRRPSSTSPLPPSSQPTIDEIKAQKISEIDQTTERIILSGFVHNGNHFSTSQHAQSNLLSMEIERLAGRMQYPLYWSLTDGSSISIMQESEWLALYGAAKNHILQSKVAGLILRNQVAIITDIEELNAWTDSRNS